MNSKVMLNLRRALPAVAAIGGAAIAAGVASYLYGSLIEARRYHLEMVRIRIPRDVNGSGVPPRPPLRVLHISDLHLAQPESHKVEFLRRITSMDYDMIVLTGDVFEDFTGIQYAEALLKRRPRYGAYAVLGNHDYYDYSYFNKIIGRLFRKFRHPPEKRQVEPMVEALEKVGYKVLRHQAIEIPEARLQVIGIDYPGIAGGALKKLVDEAPDDYLRLALLHVPHNLNILPESGIDVAFAGHTHGGQVRIPGIGAIITDSELHRKEASGVVYRKHTAIHVSRGLGADPKTNFRIFCPPAATVIHVDQ
jgi:predicted MPP superfamily phosphohydrolase